MKVFLMAFTIMVLSSSFALAKKAPRPRKDPKSVTETVQAAPKSQMIAPNISLNEVVLISSQFAYDYLRKPILGESCILYLLMKTIGRGGPNTVPTFAYLLKPEDEVRKGWSVYKVIDEKKRKYKIAVFPGPNWLEGEGRQNDLVTVCR